MAVVVVHAGDAKGDDGNSSAFTPNQILGGDFRPWIIPLWIERPVLVDALAGFAGCMNEHRAGKDELLDVECLERAEQATGPTNRDLVVQRTWISGEVVVRRQ